MMYDHDTGTEEECYDPTQDEDFILDTGEIIETQVEMDADVILPEPSCKMSTVIGVDVGVYTWSSPFKLFVAVVSVARDVLHDGLPRIKVNTYHHIGEASLQRAYRMQAKVLEISLQKCHDDKLAYEQEFWR